MSTSNLPPGCNSDDGGIDHAWEAALDNLVQTGVTTEELIALKNILPGLREVMKQERADGFQEGKLEAQLESAQSLENENET